MSEFHTAVQDFIEAIDTQSHREIGTRAHKVVELTEHIDQQDASWGIMGLVPLLTDPHCPYHAMISCVCEPLMRQGGDPWLVVGLMVERLRDSLRHAVEFRQVFRERCQAAGVDPAAELRDHGDVWKTLARENSFQAYVAGSVDLYAMPVLPIVAHFPQARQLLRADPATLDHAYLLAGESEGLRELVRVLEQHGAEPVEPQAVAVEEALRQLGEAVALGPDAGRAVSAGLMGLYRALFSVELATRNLALHGLAELIPEADAGHLGEMGRLAGSIVETGGDPNIALDAILARLPEVLGAAAAFVEACRSVVPGGAVEDEEDGPLIEQFGEQVAARLPAEARAFQTAGPLCLGAIAMLSRGVEARKHACDDDTLIDLTWELGGVIPSAGFLRKMLLILDDEDLIVLEPELPRGWRVKIRGLADNFQLHTLLAGALIGPAEEGWIPGLVGIARDGQAEAPVPGRPLDRRAVGLSRNLPCTMKDLTVNSHVQLWTWEALQADGSLPENPLASSDYFVWNEGVPADIPRFGDVRVVLVGSCPFSRSWPTGRVFHGMTGDLTIEETLAPDAVIDWLHRLATAPR